PPRGSQTHVPCSSFYRVAPGRDLHSFPTRRSSDLARTRSRTAAWLHDGHCPGPRPHSRRQPNPVHQSWAIPTRGAVAAPAAITRSEEHTSELQSRGQLVCRLLLEKKKVGDLRRGPE